MLINAYGQRLHPIDCCREEKFEKIESRLSRLDNSLQSFNEAKRAGKPTPVVLPSQGVKARSEHIPAKSFESPSEDTFSNSFDIRSSEAGKFLEVAVGNSGHSDKYNQSSTYGSSLRKPCQHTQFEHDLPMPSKDLVIKAVRLAKGMHTCRATDLFA